MKIETNMNSIDISIVSNHSELYSFQGKMLCFDDLQ